MATGSIAIAAGFSDLWYEYKALGDGREIMCFTKTEAFCLC